MHVHDTQSPTHTHTHTHARFLNHFCAYVAYKFHTLWVAPPTIGKCLLLNSKKGDSMPFFFTLPPTINKKKKKDCHCSLLHHHVPLSTPMYRKKKKTISMHFFIERKSSTITFYATIHSNAINCEWSRKSD